jgi:hypothetical protein
MKQLYTLSNQWVKLDDLKQANVLESSDIKDFLTKADDSDYLLEKVYVVLGLNGVLRAAECPVIFRHMESCDLYILIDSCVEFVEHFEGKCC